MRQSHKRKSNEKESDVLAKRGKENKGKCHGRENYIYVVKNSKRFTEVKARGREKGRREGRVGNENRDLQKQETNEM